MTLQKFLTEKLGINSKETQKLLELLKDPDVAFLKSFVKGAVETDGTAQQEDFELVLGFDIEDCGELKRVVVPVIEVFYNQMGYEKVEAVPFSEIRMKGLYDMVDVVITFDIRPATVLVTTWKHNLIDGF